MTDQARNGRRVCVWCRTVAFSAVALRCCLALALLGGASGCASSPATLSSGVVHVSFTTDETCGFSNPYTVEARGCRRLDAKAVMCKGFGIIDGVLFAGGCEAPAELEVLETQGTMPLSPPRGEPAPVQALAPEDDPASLSEPIEPAKTSDEPAPEVKKKARSSSKKTKKSAKRKKR